MFFGVFQDMLLIPVEHIERGRADLIIRGLQLELATCKRTGEKPTVEIVDELGTTISRCGDGLS